MWLPQVTSNSSTEPHYRGVGTILRKGIRLAMKMRSELDRNRARGSSVVDHKQTNKYLKKIDRDNNNS